MSYRISAAAALFACANIVAPSSAAHAELVLSQLVVELEPGKNVRHDVEVWNNGSDLTYVAVEPTEIVGAGTPTESRRKDPNPEELGLLISPARMVLEPGQRKLLRVAAIDPVSDRERVYRVTVKPVVGQLSSERSGLKILIGYDMLVLVRPAAPNPQLKWTRSGNHLVLRNEGNISAELTDGKQCDTTGKVCDPLPGGRVYVGAEKKVPIDPARRAYYLVKFPGKQIPSEF